MDMKTTQANVLIVLDDNGKEIGMIKGSNVYRLDVPLQGEEIAEVMTNNGDALPIMNGGEHISPLNGTL